VTGFSKRKLISSALLGAWTHKRAGKYGFYARRSMSAFGGKADMTASSLRCGPVVPQTAATRDVGKAIAELEGFLELALKFLSASEGNALSS